MSEFTASEFIPKQIEAIENDTPRVCVTAGPGSGKTRVLVERVLRRVTAGRLDLSRTLAITFTENAAAEMKTRLADAFQKAGREEYRRLLEQAYISTIHGLCARLLHEHAIEARVDPRFQVLDEMRAGILKQAALDSILQQRSLEDHDRFVEFTRHLGNEYLVTLIKLYDTVRQLGGNPEDEAELLKAIPEEGPRRRPQRGAKPGDPLNEDPAASRERAAEEHRGEVARLLAGFHREYTARKDAVSGLDFDDLEQRALRMLEADRELASRISRRFQEILVDEYQDTSPVQDRIIQLLAAESRLFVVGDADQSIYAFRNADPEAFLRYAREAKARAGEVQLRKDFRSRPEIIRAVNQHFSRRFKEVGTDFQRLEADDCFAEKDQPSVEMMLIAAGNGVSDGRNFEARHLARRLRELIESRALRVTNRREDDFGRELGYGDVAMLFRAASDIKKYERALEDLGIPYFSETGRGFYQAREVRDVVCFLSVLDNPRNEIALASLLRSPMFGVSDDALYLLADYAHSSSDGKLSSRGGRLSDALSAADAVPGLPSGDAARVRDLSALLERLRGERAWRSLSDMVREIVRGTRYDSTLLLETSGRRKLANLHKLAEVAASLEAAGFHSLKDFVRAVDQFRFEEVREGEAQLDSAAEGAVRLMTMHAAKGLEFPVVVLPDLSRQPPGGGGPVAFRPDFGIGVKFDWGKGPEKTPALERIREQVKLQEQAERQRVLFVAMTRAQEHLILSGCLKQTKNGFKPAQALRQVSESYDLAQIGVDRVWRDRVVGKDDQPFTVRLLCTDEEIRQEWDPSKAPIARRYRAALEAGSSLGIPVDPKDEEAAARLARAALAPRAAVDSTEFLAAATDLMEFHACPRRYYLGRYLGYDTAPQRFAKLEELLEPEEEEESGTGEGDEFPRSEVGREAHKVLAAGPGALAGVPTAIRGEVERLANAFWKSEYAALKGDVRRELPVLAALDGRFLRGVLDVLTFEAGVPHLLLDYKANEISASEVEEKAAYYRTQMLLYALLVEAAFGSLPRRAVLFFLAPAVAYPVELTPGALAETRGLVERFFAAQRQCEFPPVVARHCYACPFNLQLCLATTRA